MDFDFDETYLDLTGVSLDDKPAARKSIAVVKAPEVKKELVATTKQSQRPPRSAPLFWDLETVPDESRMHLFDLEELPPVPEEVSEKDLPSISELLEGTAEKIEWFLTQKPYPAKWLDEVAAAELLKKKRVGVAAAVKKGKAVRQGVIDAHQERIKLLSTTPEFCSIAAFGWAVGNEESQSVVAGKDCTEPELLAKFWKLANSCSQLIGYNCLAFDLRVIFARSALLGVASSRSFDTRPWGTDIIDLYLARFGTRGNTDKSRPGTLKRLAKVYGIDVPADDFDGSKVYEAMQTPEGREMVAFYVKSDISVTRDLYQKLSGLFWV